MILKMLWSNYHQSLPIKPMPLTGKLQYILVQHYAILVQKRMKIVALKRILGLYHAKECDEVDLDKQIANLGFDFKKFYGLGFQICFHSQVHAACR